MPRTRQTDTSPAHIIKPLRPFSSSLCSFLITLRCDSDFLTVFFFAGAYFRPDLAAIRREKFTARYFWFKAKLKQKKFILK